ncbi:MAG: GGDEF domain-containing protein [Deltaproteobacteria bacterium]|nr:GGDEF domain-containing protein [Deltaproteobacteria bacterium]
MTRQEQTAVERTFEQILALAEESDLFSLGRKLTESIRDLRGPRSVHLYLEEKGDELALLSSSAAPGTEVAPGILYLTATRADEPEALEEAFGRPFDGHRLLTQGGMPLGVIVWADGDASEPAITDELLEGYLKVASALLYARLEAKSAFDASERDLTTGLYSGVHYEGRLIEEVARAVRHERTLSLILLSIDEYETHRKELAGAMIEASILRLAGFLAGDEPEVLHSRDGDVAARLGECRFALLLPDTPKEGAMVKAERVRATVASSLQGAGGRIITVSIGVAGFPEDALDSAGLHEAARSALGTSRAFGGNRVSKA